MTTNIINEGNAVTGDGTPVYYNSSHSSAGVTELTFQVYGPGGIADYNPSGTAFVEYYDPLSGQTTVETFVIGGQIGPSEISINTGSLYDGDSIGQVRITFVDDANIPGAGPGAKFLGTLGKVLKTLGYVGNAVDGVFGVPGYHVSLLDQETTEIDFNSTYPPGHLEGMGINPNNLPEWISPAYDAQGNFVGLDFQQCFGAGTPIDMWPLAPSLKPGPDGVYDQAAVRAGVWKKPIEEVMASDTVVSFDKQGNLVPGTVTRTMTNNAKIILDFHGTFVTPGHVYWCAGCKFEGKYAPLIDILRDDGVIQHQDGTLIRASTGCEFGTPDDEEFHVFQLYIDKHGQERVSGKTKLRYGTRWMAENGQHFTMREYMDSIGVEIIQDGPQCGYARWKETGVITPFAWVLSDTLPNPEDFVLARSATSLEEIYKAGQWEFMHPQMPAPLAMDGGPVQPLPERKLELMPRNEPLAFRSAAPSSELLPDRKPRMNRRQRKAAEVQARRAARNKRPKGATLH